VFVAVCALGVAAGLLAAVAGSRVFAPPAVLTVVVTFLPYLVAVGLAVLFAGWSVVPDRRLPPLLMALLLGAGLVRWGPPWSVRAQESVGTPVTVMSWNLRRLWGGTDDQGDPVACAVSAIEAAAPDALTLTEVSANDVHSLEDLAGLTCAHHPYKQSSDPDHGGLATCVRGEDWTLLGGAGQRFVDDEDWYYVFSEIQGPGRILNLLAVHLSPYAWSASVEDAVRDQSDQAAALLLRVSRVVDPTVVAGDFNSTRDAALHTELRKHLRDAWELGGMGFGATIRYRSLVPLRIDYVYGTEELAVQRTRVVDVGCSDHRPIVTEMVLAR